MAKFERTTEGYTARAKELLAAGFTTKAAQKDALDCINQAFDMARDGVQKACLATMGERKETPMSEAVNAVYWDVPSYPHQFKAKHSAQILATFPDLGELVATMEALAALRDVIKAAPITPVETKAAAARRVAAEIVAPTSTNVVAAAVAPQKADAVAKAEQEANKFAARVAAKLNAAAGDLDAIAPRGNYRTDRDEDRKAKDARRALFSRLMSRRPGTELWMMDAELCERFVEGIKAEAAVDYDAFTAKLALKVGTVTTATLKGNHVWGQSFLTVTNEDGSEAVWHTQQILNISKLGKLFNQWPTRLVK